MHSVQVEITSNEDKQAVTTTRSSDVMSSSNEAKSRFVQGAIAAKKQQQAQQTERFSVVNPLI